MDNKTNWVLKVSKELNEEVFTAAHNKRVSKAEYIRQAVREAVQRHEGKKPQLTEEDKKLSKKLLGAEISQEYIEEVTTEVRREDSHFNPQPKKDKKK